MGSHEDTSTAGLIGTLVAETLNFSITVDLVILQNSQLGPIKERCQLLKARKWLQILDELLALVLDLLWGVVNLLLPLFTPTN